MKIFLSICGPLRRPPGVRDGICTCPDGARVADVLAAHFGLSPTECEHLLVHINHQPASLHDQLHDGDELLLFLPVGGGM